MFTIGRPYRCLLLAAFGLLLAVPTQLSIAEDEPTADQLLAKQLRGYATNIQFNKDNTVRLVRLSKSKVTDEHLAIVAAFDKLDYLAIVCPQITDLGIAQLSGLTNLDTLMLSESGVTDAGLAAVANLAKLQRLYLDSTAIGDSSLAIVGKLEQLEVLSLVDTKVSDVGLRHLQRLGHLETLRLDGTSVTSDAIKPLSKLAPLRFLYLARCDIDDISGLSDLPSLKHLSLNATAINDQAIDEIAKCQSLETLEIYSTSITAGRLRALKEQRPKLRVYADPNPSPQVKALPATSSEPIATPSGKVDPSIRQRLADSNEWVPDFQRHVVPLLGRLGCNSRSCHGSFQGQGGFRLSMFGYDFQMDHQNLAERIDVDDVNDSLILNKPTSADEHEGGMRLPPDSWQQELLRRWIAGGAKGLPQQPASFVRLEVSPREIVFAKPDETVPLQVLAVWSDGAREDVTDLARFESKDDAIAAVTSDGEVTAIGKGDTHIIALYDNGIVPIPVVLPISDQAGEQFPVVTSRTKIDELVIAKLRKLGIVPAQLANDEMFLRRASLDLIGTLPTPDEIREFVADTSPEKRSKKIDQLLQRDAYVAWWTNLLCDLTGSNAGYLGGTEMAQPVAKQWRDWMELRVRENIGWDEIARGIITATSRRPGQSYAEYVKEQSTYTRPGDTGFARLGNPMPHFWYRDNISIPSDKALAFGYTFMGVRLDCAQCHKHPFDQWSKQDFDHFTQFFTRIKKGTAPDAADLHESMRNMLGVPVKLDTAALRRQSYLRIAAEGRPIPWNEIYIDPPGQKPQIAKLLGVGNEIDLNQFADPRLPLFEWLLTEPNHYFAKSFVNRIWAHYFNVGIIDPPDDMNLANPPSNGPLLDYLTDAFIESGYDMKWLHRTIMTSDTYQRSWKSNETNRTDEHNFSHAIVRRLPAEVAVDAVIQATANDSVMSMLASDVKNRKITQHPKSYQTRSIDFSLLVFGKPLRTTNCDCERQNDPTLVQALYLRNDDETLAMLDRIDGWLKQLEKSKPEDLDITSLVQAAYLRVLSRMPNETETSLCVQHFSEADSTIEGLRDLLWSLLNTQEFITNH